MKKSWFHHSPIQSFSHSIIHSFNHSVLPSFSFLSCKTPHLFLTWPYKLKPVERRGATRRRRILPDFKTKNSNANYYPMANGNNPVCGRQADLRLKNRKISQCLYKRNKCTSAYTQPFSLIRYAIR